MSITNQSKTSSAMTNSSRIAYGETWATDPYTWATEPRTWSASGTLFSNTSKTTSSISNQSKPI